MLETARDARADGDPETAGERAREALGLWRGPPLADLAYESFAQADITRLEELRLAAQEEWVEAQLQLGRHAEVVPELEALVSRHPLRERLLGQLMLALYRSDRQAEALNAYQEGRRTLAEELGLEPSESLQQLERRILEHDPALAAPLRSGAPRFVPSPVWRHPRVVVLVGAVVLAVALGAFGMRVAASAEGSGVDVEGSGVAALDGRSGAVTKAVATRVPPTAMTAGLGYVWAASADSNMVVVLDPKTNTVHDTIPLESAPGGIAIGGSSVWVTNSLTSAVSQISPETFEVLQTIPVGNGPTGIAAAGRHVWVANTGDHTVSKLRAIDGKVVETFPAVTDPGAIAVGEGAVWVASKLGAVVVKLHPASGDVLDPDSGRRRAGRHRRRCGIDLGRKQHFGHGLTARPAYGCRPRNLRCWTDRGCRYGRGRRRLGSGGLGGTLRIDADDARVTRIVIGIVRPRSRQAKASSTSACVRAVPRTSAAP